MDGYQASDPGPSSARKDTKVNVKVVEGFQPCRMLHARARCAPLRCSVRLQLPGMDAT